ncbi:hypothetical protein K0M31_019881 [Melipona bicolor]|uniref:Uncharacterized protein n=1 Tax=Melipona bicolor TaxID=60889 RepID=A0AA40G0I4_9HYME|nr:hypothetical protein K0M31_019881 [Melipona bicolor]
MKFSIRDVKRHHRPYNATQLAVPKNSRPNGGRMEVPPSNDETNKQEKAPFSSKSENTKGTGKFTGIKQGVPEMNCSKIFSPTLLEVVP